MTIWVIDSSSLIAIKENSFALSERKRILAAMSELVNKGFLLYPPQVVPELARYADGDPTKQDEIYAWAADNRRAGASAPPDAIVREVFANPTARNVIDPNKTGVEEADPYVLALAKQIGITEKDVVVVAEETRDKPSKTSIATACGALRLYRIPLLQFLKESKIT